MHFRQYSVVRIRQLLRPLAEYDGWRLNQRPPQVGDSGTIVDVFSPHNYVVESSGSDGITIWLGDFLAEELELMND